ncbi:hypothetical protein QW060_20450, partial [Myroides ceti]
ASASARVHQRINFDTDKSNISLSNWSSPTWHSSAPGFRRTAEPSGGFTTGFGIFKDGLIRIIVLRLLMPVQIH